MYKDSLFPVQLARVGLVVPVKYCMLCRLRVVPITAAIHEDNTPRAKAYDRLVRNAVCGTQVLECESPADDETVAGVVVQDDMQVRIETRAKELGLYGLNELQGELHVHYTGIKILSILVLSGHIVIVYKRLETSR